MNSTDNVEAIQRALEALLRRHASRRVYARQAAVAGATISQPAYVLLRRVKKVGPLPMGELARLTNMDPGATARQVGQLEREGYVKRSPSPDDGRVSLVSLTPRGDAVRRRLTSVMDQHLNEMLSKWSEEDRAAFAVLLGRFVDDMATTELHATVEDDDDTD
ncbi:MarR family winged helix-turn-helix transcriptional regulator [Yinghuangia sp. YIM S10712]|uniref:MarR family winged helix-turn-helix transcriptional regulator n=1 Tax=Yinghuangia sp. YIM S10712 TaxID=3436930 RepID=UPI003F539A39